MKYTKSKTEHLESKAGAEIKRIFNAQDPPLGPAAAAALLGVSYETLRSVMSDERVPSAGFINGIARVLKLSDKQVSHLMRLRESDLLQKKLNKVANPSGKVGLDQMATLLEVLDEEQIAQVQKVAMKFALANRAKK